MYIEIALSIERLKITVLSVRCCWQICGYIHIGHEIGRVQQLIVGNGNRRRCSQWRHANRGCRCYVRGGGGFVELSLVELRCEGAQQATLQGHKERIERTRNDNNARYYRTETYAEGRKVIPIMADHNL